MKNIEEFIEALRSERFKEAHSILEPDWKESKKIDTVLADFLKGLINGATALALIQEGRIVQGERVWGTFLKYESLLDSLKEKEDKLKEATEILKKYAIDFGIN